LTKSSYGSGGNYGGGGGTYAFDRRAAAAARIAAARVQQANQAGTFTVTGTGEATFVVTFPLIFMDKPIFTFGSELGPNQTLVAGSFPTASATVSQWTTKSGTLKVTYYIGATIVVVVTGPAGATGATGQSMQIHYNFTGRVFSPQPSTPINTTGTA